MELHRFLSPTLTTKILGIVSFVTSLSLGRELDSMTHSSPGGWDGRDGTPHSKDSVSKMALVERPPGKQ